jgi:hypothetical protein
MKQRFAYAMLSIAILVTAGVITQAQTSKPAPSPAGQWTLTLESPHGKMVAGFELKVEGRTVTGEFASDHTGKMAVAGEFADGRVTFKTADGALAISAKMKDADTMSAVLSTERGDLTGVATRVKK